MIDLKDRRVVRDIIDWHMELCVQKYEEDGDLEFLDGLDEIRQSADNNDTDISDMVYKELDRVIDDFCEKNDLCKICFRGLSHRTWKEYPDQDAAPGFYVTYGEDYCPDCE